MTLGNDILLSATADDYDTVKHTHIHLIGAAWQRYVEWAAVDPLELIVGGNYDGTPLWSRNLDDHAATDAALCGTCDIANFARRFYFHANLPLFRRLYRSGIIYSVDRSANPGKHRYSRWPHSRRASITTTWASHTTRRCGTMMSALGLGYIRPSVTFAPCATVAPHERPRPADAPRSATARPGAAGRPRAHRVGGGAA